MTTAHRFVVERNGEVIASFQSFSSAEKFATSTYYEKSKIQIIDRMARRLAPQVWSVMWDGLDWQVLCVKCREEDRPGMVGMHGHHYMP